MKLSERIVIKLPLDSLWTDSEELDAKRIQYDVVFMVVICGQR